MTRSGDDHEGAAIRDEVRDALERLMAALEAHADAAAAVSRADIPDPLPQASQDLVEAVHEYRRVLEHWTGAYVPLAVAEAPETAPAVASVTDIEADAEDSPPPPDRDGLDWAGGAERWR